MVEGDYTNWVLVMIVIPWTSDANGSDQHSSEARQTASGLALPLLRPCGSCWSFPQTIQATTLEGYSMSEGPSTGTSEPLEKWV